jgi:acyl dehydratase
MNLERLRAFEFPLAEQAYTKRDSLLYALGLGYGTRPVDADHLRFVYEDGIESVPSMCVVLAYPGFWARDPRLELDWLRLLHAEHYFKIHHTIPAEGRVISAHQVTAVSDKGPGKGALLYLQKELHNHDGLLLATVRQTLFLRGDGGCGSFGVPPEDASPLPQLEPDKVIAISTSPNAALLYRLNGDWNPIHAEPKTAQAAGLERPILQGLCSMGLACRAILELYCGGDPSRFRSLFVRFSKPVFPGDTIRFEFYENGPTLRFRAAAVERNIIVLDRCAAQLKP